MPRPAKENTVRFPMEIPPTSKARLMRAAALENTSVKDFVLRNALRAADDVIERAEVIKLSERDHQRLLDLLENPPPPTDKLLAAAKRLVANDAG